MVENVLLVAFVLVVVTTDWRWQRIPNAVTYPTMLAGIVLGAIEGIPGSPFAGGLLDHVAGIAIAFLVAYPFYAAGGLKAGDGKLLMAVGGLKGAIFLLTAALYGALAGGVLAVVLIAARRLAPPETEVPDPFWRVMKSRIPYGVALGIGALIALAVELRPA